MEEFRMNKLETKIAYVLFVALLLSCSSSKQESTKDSETTNYSSYQEAARAYDFEAAHKILDQIHEDYLSHSDDDEKRGKYESAFDYIFNAEAMFLCSKGDEESLNRIIFLLSDIPLEGVAISENQTIGGVHGEKKEAHEKYIKYATRLNQKCNNLIDFSIAYRKFSLAEKILPFYKGVPDLINNTVDVEKTSQHREKNHVVEFFCVKQIMKYSYSDKENAIKKINKAIDDGVFPDVINHLK